MPVLKPPGQGLFKFCITVECHERQLLCIFLSQTSIHWTKRARRSEILRFLSDSVKIHQIPCVMFETTNRFSVS